jgi:hypothetical protein
MHHHASGTLVQFSDHYFLVTAAHAIEDYHKGRNSYSDLCLFIDNGDTENLVPLDDGHYLATEFARDPDNPRLCGDEGRDDILDIGLWELDRHTVDALTTKSFLNRRSISLTEDLSTGVFFLAGVPCSWATADATARSLNLKMLRYIAHPYPEKDTLPNYDEKFHMALCLGENLLLPGQLNGISGCSIWKLSDTPVMEDWSPDEAKVIAIETCVYTKQRDFKAIRGTKWQWVVSVLSNMHPEIRESFKLWLPGKE